MAHTLDHAPRSTVVALVGIECDALLADLGASPALAALSLRTSDPAVVTQIVAGAHTPYVVHDADPLEHVATAWAELYEERSTLGVLETEVELLLELFAAGDVVMPDYYLVAGPESIDGTLKHWWLGALAHHAPNRVLPVEPTGSAVRAQLRSLPTSRFWPDPAEWLPQVAFEIPDRVGLPEREAS